MQKLAVVVVLLCVFHPAFAQEKPSRSPDRSGQEAGTGTKALENQLVNNEQRLAQSEKNKGREFLRQTLADDFIYVAYNGEAFTKDKIVQAVKYMDISNYRMENFKVRVLGRQAALLTYDLLVQGNVGGHQIPQKEYASSVWVAMRGRWTLVFHQETPARHG